jgi:hypothetical protein
MALLHIGFNIFFLFLFVNYSNRWSDFNFNLFNITSSGSQIGEFITGILLTISSIIGVIFGRKYIRQTLKLD